MATKNHFTTRIPIDDEYAAIVGKAIYAFAYYEWTIIYMIDSLMHGFVTEYSRPLSNPLTSGVVCSRLKKAINHTQLPVLGVTTDELDNCTESFERLIIKRNALIHGHPITSKDGSQILAYQTSSSKMLSDMIWTSCEVEQFIKEIDNAAVESGVVLQKLRKKP